MTKVYTNVVFLAVVAALMAGTVFKTLVAVGAASIVLPLTVALTLAFFQVALIFGQRQAAFTGWLAPWSINAASLFLSAAIVLPVGLVLGGRAFLDSVINAVDPQSVALGVLMALLSPIVVSIGSVIMAFASREQQTEPNGD